MGSSSRNDEHNEPVHSLWPKIEEVKYLEVCDELPVSAFGCPVPKIAPRYFFFLIFKNFLIVCFFSEFSLPWLDNPDFFETKKVSAKRTVKRKSSKR